MIEKPKRPKKIPNQDNKQPQTIEQLIRRYDLDNTKIYDFLDELVGQLNQAKTVAKRIWSGNLYTTGGDNTEITSEIFEANKLYLFIVQGLSGSFTMTIPYIHGSGRSIQYGYYDGTTVVRWRIVINSTNTGFYLSENSLNMGSTTGILEVYKIDL